MKVQLLKQPNWVDEHKVGSSLPRAPKTTGSARTPQAASTDDQKAFVSGTSPNRRRMFKSVSGSSERVFLIVGAQSDLDCVLGMVVSSVFHTNHT